MTEIFIAGGVLGLLIGGAALVSMVDWYYLFGGGLSLVVLGFLLGVPTGFYYHVLLYRALKPRGVLPKDWWLRPHLANPALTDAERPRVMRYFFLGAVGFGVIVLGCVLFTIGALRS